MNSLKCPQCGLVNFADAAACKRCGQLLQDFSQTSFNNTPYNNSPNPYGPATTDSGAYNQNQTPPQPDPRYESGGNSGKYVKKMIFGALWAVGGTIATFASYGSASGGGGKYFIFWGAILFGVIDFLIGLNGYVTGKD